MKSWRYQAAMFEPMLTFLRNKMQLKDYELCEWNLSDFDLLTATRFMLFLETLLVMTFYKLS